MTRFTASVDVDRRLYHHDIQGSIAHANGLCRAGVLSEAECEAIIDGLNQVRAEIEADEFAGDPALEDVHMNIEARLTELIGATGKKLHTGRSRNDQVATDVRLWLRDRVDVIDRRLTEVMTVLLDRAGEHIETVMPGLTHLQTAQPVTFAHHLMAWFEMAWRDRERFATPASESRLAARQRRAGGHDVPHRPRCDRGGTWVSTRRPPTRWTP